MTIQHDYTLTPILDGEPDPYFHTTIDIGADFMDVIRHMNGEDYTYRYSHAAQGYDQGGQGNHFVFGTYVDLNI